MLKKILTTTIGLLTIPIFALAINITVPSAPSSGYMLISTSTGAYVASSTLLSKYVTFTYASSTFPSFSYASSTFASTSWVLSTFQTKLTNPLTGLSTTSYLAYFSGPSTIAGLATGTAGYVLQSSSTASGNMVWVATSSLGFPTGGSGTVTSIGIATSSGISVSGTNPITTSGTFTLGVQSGYSIPLSASTTNWNNLYDNVLSRLAISTSTIGSSWYITTSTNSINVNIPTAGAATSGVLSSTDWTTFNNKQPAGAYLTSVTADAPLSGAGTAASHLVFTNPGYITLSGISGTAPVTYNNGTGAIGITLASSTANGYLSSTDWSTFNNKQNALTNPVTGLSTSSFLAYFTGASTISGLATGTAGYLLVASSTAASGLEYKATSTLGFTSGTVTSVGLAMPTGYTVSNSPVTTTGTLTAAVTAGYIGPFTTSLTKTGTDVTLATTTSSLVLNIPVASGSATGTLTATDWTTFNGKQANLFTLLNGNIYNNGTSTQTLSIGTSTPFATTSGDIAPLYIVGSSTLTTEVVLQNTSSGASSSADYVLTSNNGNDSTYFAAFGINNANQNNGLFTVATSDDAYLYNSDGSMLIGTASSSANSYLGFFTGGTLAANERVRITSTGLVGIGTTSPTTQLYVQGTTTLDSIGLLWGARNSTTAQTLNITAYGTVATTTANGGIAGGDTIFNGSVGTDGDANGAGGNLIFKVGRAATRPVLIYSANTSFSNVKTPTWTVTTNFYTATDITEVLVISFPGNATTTSSATNAVGTAFVLAASSSQAGAVNGARTEIWTATTTGQLGTKRVFPTFSATTTKVLMSIYYYSGVSFVTPVYSATTTASAYGTNSATTTITSFPATSGIILSAITATTTATSNDGITASLNNFSTTSPALTQAVSYADGNYPTATTSFKLTNSVSAMVGVALNSKVIFPSQDPLTEIIRVSPQMRTRIGGNTTGVANAVLDINGIGNYDPLNINYSNSSQSLALFGNDGSVSYNSQNGLIQQKVILPNTQTGIATSSYQIGTSGNNGQLCIWNGTNYTKLYFAAGSITPIWLASATCN